MLTTFGESKGALTIKIPSKKPLSNAEITKKDKFSPSPIHRDVTALRCHLCRQEQRHVPRRAAAGIEKTGDDFPAQGLQDAPEKGKDH
ncbi:MAG: hypothetical protein PHH77_08030 [Victivallaceae bacterium]|nr:hypothetical protein [Victivallaceae bacterium]